MIRSSIRLAAALTLAAIAFDPAIATAEPTSPPQHPAHAAPDTPATATGGAVAVSRRPAARPAKIAALPRTLEGASQLTCIAVAIYHEARDQSYRGQAAVAAVILRRAAIPHRWADTPCGVVVPVQFSFLAADGSFPPIRDAAAWNRALFAAATVLRNGPPPAVARADHYHTTAVAPDWRSAMVRLARIGDHIFYADPDFLSPLAAVPAT